MRYQANAGVRGARAWWSVCALALWATAASAQEGGVGTLDQKFWLEVGAFNAGVSSSLRADASSGGMLAGSDINVENDLGLARRRTVGSLLLGARLDERWRLEFEYFRLHRSATREIQGGDLQFGDTTYPVSAVVASRFDSQVYRASAGYSFYRSPSTELGVVGGLHVTKFDVRLDGSLNVSGGAVTSGVEHKSATVPLPTVGLYGTTALGKDWLLGGRVDLFSLNRGGYRGRLVNAQLNLAYRVTPNVALGVGYRFDDYRLSSNRANWTGDVNYRFSGPQITLQAGF